MVSILFYHYSDHYLVIPKEADNDNICEMMMMMDDGNDIDIEGMDDDVHKFSIDISAVDCFTHGCVL